MKPHLILFCFQLTLFAAAAVVAVPKNDTTTTSIAATAHNFSNSRLCLSCAAESLEFLIAHNLVRARKWELPLLWDPRLEQYAQWWAGVRTADCALQHSFPEDGFVLGENIFWGGGSKWTPTDAVKIWADEEKYYDYQNNTCADGQMCGHYTQIVWSKTRSVGCARVVCESGDVFMTCNYYPPGNYVGERPY